MQNKANFLKAQINLKSFRITDYDDFAALGLRKNKAKRWPLAGNPKQDEWVLNDSHQSIIERERF